MNGKLKKIISASLLIMATLSFVGCEELDNVNQTNNDTKSKNVFTILSGSENKALEQAGIFTDFEKENNIKIKFNYKGSVDTMQKLQSGKVDEDAVWVANSIWFSLGDKNKIVKNAKSIYTSPVAFGIKKSVAEKLGFVNKQVSVRDILKATQEKKLSFIMTSASQSNSGATAYLSFMYALKNSPDVISKADLDNKTLQNDLKTLLGNINRSSASSDFLKDLYLKGDYQAMVNYESVIIDTNKELIKQNREPLYIVYPYDGTSISDAPLGYISHGDNAKEELFKKFQTYLLSDNVQNKLQAIGRRTGLGGTVTNPDATVFNKDWGIDTNKILTPIKMPTPEVIIDALNLYQTELKKPSYTIFCLDFSGSMGEGGNKSGANQVKEAMTLLLDQEKAKVNFLQSTQNDVSVVIPFNDRVKNVWRVSGNNQDELNGLLSNIKNLSPGGGTNVYVPVIQGLDILKEVDLNKYFVSVVLMTDGKSTDDYKAFEQKWKSINKDIPVFSIEFGDAEDSQLDAISNLTKASTLNKDKKDLIGAFKTVRGYN